MGVLIINNKNDQKVELPFPSRLFGAIFEIEVSKNQNNEIWERLKFQYWSSFSYLDLRDLSHKELVIFMKGVESLMKEIQGKEMYANIYVSEINDVLKEVLTHKEIVK